jgi:hypothetical protein
MAFTGDKYNRKMSSCQTIENNGKVGKTWGKMKMAKAGMEVIEPRRRCAETRIGVFQLFG